MQVQLEHQNPGWVAEVEAVEDRPFRQVVEEAEVPVDHRSFHLVLGKAAEEVVEPVHHCLAVAAEARMAVVQKNAVASPVVEMAAARCFWLGDLVLDGKT